MHRTMQDFYNLADVYLDAVFHPECLRNPQIFQQEGWHYELDNAEQQEMEFKGVVFNEMKGALQCKQDWWNAFVCVKAAGLQCPGPAQRNCLFLARVLSQLYPGAQCLFSAHAIERLKRWSQCTWLTPYSPF